MTDEQKNHKTNIDNSSSIEIAIKIKIKRNSTIQYLDANAQKSNSPSNKHILKIISNTIIFIKSLLVILDFLSKF